LERAAGVLGADASTVSATLTAATLGVGGPLRADPDSVDSRATDVLARLGARAATWNRREVAREAAAILREAGARVDDASVKTLADAVEAHGDSVSLTSLDVGGVVPDGMRRADGSGVFVRRGEQLLTSKPILNAERDLAELAALRSLPDTESADGSGRAGPRSETMTWCGGWPSPKRRSPVST